MPGNPAKSIIPEEGIPVPPAPSSFPKFVTAVEHIRRLRGGSQPHLMRCSDGHFYVVKFRNNPQSPRVLVNEYLAGRLAKHLGLPCPTVCLVDVKESLIRLTPDLSVELPKGRVPVTSGLSFGSRYPSWGCGKKRVLFPTLDLRTALQLGRIDNLPDLLGMLVFDRWTLNTDVRQIACLEQYSESGRTFRLFMVDNGFCFGDSSWRFNNSRRHSLDLDERVCSKILDDRLLDTWLQRLEIDLTLEDLNKISDELPEIWVRDDRVELVEMLNRLYERKKTVPALAHQDLSWMKGRLGGEPGQAVAAD